MKEKVETKGLHSGYILDLNISIYIYTYIHQPFKKMVMLEQLPLTQQVQKPSFQ